MPEMLVNGVTASNPSIAEDAAFADGTFFIVWVSVDQGGDGGGIFAQYDDARGERIGVTFPVNTTSLGNQRDPAIAATTDNGFVVVWEAPFQDVGTSGFVGVIGQRFAADGTRLGSGFVVNSVNTTFNQYDPEVAGLPAGRFAVAFRDGQRDAASDSIRIRFYAGAGNPWTTTCRSIPRRAATGSDR